VSALERDLRDALEGEVRFDAGSRGLYATDASNYRQLPIGVVLPRSAEDVENTVAACRRHGVPLLSRGGGTSLAGQCCNVAVVMDFSKYMNRILEIDPETRTARVEPGVVLDDLRNAAEEHGLTFGPDPATHDHCTLGGMIGNNSCGVHALMAGKTVDNIEELEVLTYDGLRLRVGETSDEQLAGILESGGRRAEIYGALQRLRDRHAHEIRARYPDIPRRVSGYNLDQLLRENGFHIARALVGSESTCVTVLEARCRLVQSPPGRVLVVLGFRDVAQAADRVPDILEHEPIGLEGIDERLIGYMKKQGMKRDDLDLLPDGGGWLLVELGGGDRREAESRAHELTSRFEKGDGAPSIRLYDDPEKEKRIWQIRESGLGATAHVPGEHPAHPGWEDAAVPPERLGEYLRDFRGLLDRHGYGCSLYGHFGQGCVHTRIDFELRTRAGIDAFRAFVDEAADLVVRYGGSLSGEHGDGQARAELLPKMFGAELCQAFVDFKTVWDPDGRMNPGKITRPYRVDENLRLGQNYRPPSVRTNFAFQDDGGSFAAATRRCVGVGKCRRMAGGVMCPSYRATRDESHSTRGRARLLFEMLSGGEGPGPWRDEAVRNALDLCLACKGCRSDCPVDVDMATYKAEFLSHYYAGRLRPRSAYAFGWIGRWSRIGGRLPRLANFGIGAPGLGGLLGWLAGAAPQRRLPRFARQSFRCWFRERSAPADGDPPVLLWPDTFNDHFRPHTAKAATEVLEALGYRVVIPPRPLCCGRPLYDYGMLRTARRWLERILTALRPQIQAGIPVVGLEPSCVAVFRDELCGLLPHDEDARRLREQSFTLGEFLSREDRRWPASPLERTALVQPHCHEHAVLDHGAEREVLRAAGLALEAPDAGCCGMAGAFGFERDHYDVSMRVGEGGLLPAVRDRPAETLIVADGFSCREQIRHGTPRRGLHLAEVLHAALRRDAGETLRPTYLERDYWAREQVPALRVREH
jgi:FAD/FMN-containing dehydrogenase/Fe-S oxidoreductase